MASHLCGEWNLQWYKANAKPSPKVHRDIHCFQLISAYYGWVEKVIQLLCQTTLIEHMLPNGAMAL